MVYDIRSRLLYLLASAAIAQRYQEPAVWRDRSATSWIAFFADLRAQTIYQVGK